MDAKLNIRLDDRTERELAALVEHFAAQYDALGRKVTASDVARIAIHELHGRNLAEQPASAKAPR